MKNKLFQKILDNVERAVKTFKKDTVGDEAVWLIQKRTRLGYGVESGERGGAKEKLAPLADSTIAQRQGKATFWTTPSGKVVGLSTISKKELKSLRASKSAIKQQGKINKFIKSRQPKLDGTTSPKRSNLTTTGEMLRSIAARLSGSKVIIEMLGSRNKKLLEYHTSGTDKMPARPFFELTLSELKQLRRIVREEIKKKLGLKKR